MQGKWLSGTRNGNRSQYLNFIRNENGSRNGSVNNMKKKQYYKIEFYTLEIDIIIRNLL